VNRERDLPYGSDHDGQLGRAGEAGESLAAHPRPGLVHPVEAGENRLLGGG
jgi:hypothetical protein